MKQLSERLTKLLISQPESGMGYWITTVVLRNGKSYPQTIIDSGFVIRVRGFDSVPFDVGDIADIKVTHDHWDWKREPVEPSFPYELEGYNFIGRGPGNNGWSTAPSLSYRCVKCGDVMHANRLASFHCQCKSMHLDSDYGRFGSALGDQNILVYEKKAS